VKEAVLRVNMRYAIFSDATKEYIPVVRNIFVENVTSKKSKYGILIEGYDEQHPVEGVHIKNSTFDRVVEGNKIEFGKDLHFTNLKINGEEIADQ